ncbi:flagella basal body P-ring formation protein FlgA [Vibrio sp. HA2012]|uniref:flagellar basal body P-ring formation chaperone FlgA n=1 Tax=Vibrio sp. HA2012 TaxID=1971595 RepID=UPI000C2C7053|nr:flagellar basal body P-ring formation chaperone FlgA [Vibrio sp. HA2012]PJC86410.1 flagella basal body P-ring formation protein FlgA [Vibrio sp. HA2012]
MNYIYIRKKNFRSSEAIRKSRKPEIVQAILTILLLVTTMTKVNASGERQLENISERAVQQEIADYARLHNWKNYTPRITPRVPPSAAYLPPCPPDSLHIAALDYNQEPIGNLKRQLSCNIPGQEWKISIRVKVEIELPVVIAASTISRGTMITADMLKLESITFLQPKDFVTDFSPLLEKTAKRRIRSGQIVSPSNLEQKWLVKEGDDVVIIASKDGIQATTKGIALESGTEKQQINVKNTGSGKIIRATVTARGKVKTMF